MTRVPEQNEGSGGFSGPFNQTPPFENVDLYALDLPLREAVAANGGAGADAELAAFGRRWGSAEMLARGHAANVNLPELERYDARGFRRDRVIFQPAYHALMRESMAAGLHASTWTPEGLPADAPAQVVRAAKFYMAAQVEGGHLCPITMTRAAVAALAQQPDVLRQWMPKIAATAYDPRFMAPEHKTSVTLGMGMTERQGGTDVRTNETRATREGDAYRINGQKWFMSAPMCDAFLVLAQADEGLTCFLMPRVTPAGEVNGLRFERLKDKLGNRSNASSEVIFENAHAVRVGEAGRGIRTIIQMVQLTRLDCAISSAGMMRMGLAQALHHGRHRMVFGRHLGEQPLMRSVLADLALRSEASTAFVMRLCRAFDQAENDPLEAAWMRVMTPVAKYWICKTAPGFLYEAMECLGGNGYVEAGMLARLYREAPVNAIWEGSGNVMCLDVLRAIAREGEATFALLAAFQRDCADYPEATHLLAEAAKRLVRSDAEHHARAIVETLAGIAGLISLRRSAPKIADIFARRGINFRPGNLWGASGIEPDEADAILARAMP